MYKCKSCGFTTDKWQSSCPACGGQLAEAVYHSVKVPKKSEPAPAPVQKDNQPSTMQLLYKYADYLDDATLYNAALCTEKGLGVEQDSATAKELYTVLAFRGHLDSMFKLAEMLLSSTPPDVQTAAAWLKSAAGEGHKPSSIMLQRLCDQGLVEAPKNSNAPIDLPAGDNRFEQLVKQALPCVMAITSYGETKKSSWYSRGSGFLIDGGFVITNAHVLGENFSCVTGEFDPSVDKNTYALIPLIINPAYDVAILCFNSQSIDKFINGEYLQFRTTDVAFGEEVYTIGNPLGLGLSVSKGVISSPSRERVRGWTNESSYVIQTDISANHGNSGGALLDKNNNIVGMLTFKPGDAEGGMSMCVPSEYIIGVLEALLQKMKKQGD